MPYQHLSMTERYPIDRMRLRGDTQAAIARALGRSPGTISRALRRYRVPPTPNGVGGMTGYIAGGGPASSRSASSPSQCGSPQTR